MEAQIVISDMDSILLELQTAMFNSTITDQQNNPPQHPSQFIHIKSWTLSDKVQNLIRRATNEKERRKKSMADFGRDESSMRRRDRPRFDTINAVIFVLEKMYGNVRYWRTCTRREIYYQNVGLFRNQRTVDSVVDKICRHMKLPQWELGILCSSKGLVYGPLIIKLRSGEIIDCSAQPGGTLVPQDLPNGASYKSNARFALIIEKDAAFQTILSCGNDEALNRCLFITGKGYPDMNTRVLVKDLSTKLCLPTFAIVDCDPHGLDIFFNYKYGSMAKNYINESLAAPSIFWLGVHPTDLVDFGPTELLPMTAADLKKADDLMRRPYVRREYRLIEEIFAMTSRGVKCEIESISSISCNFMSNVYIPTKISRKKFI
ncbi:hypothetical protein GE061_009303 [Apolygus lucorum]|uniref:DNA topoisomerase (ATP-hydrolyzing) n=1 Tax=Apolygus lucorum TaxID=248454 RepID=A0A6A4K4I3_APOLU|nr:hypothetical protein GE061_009303 [Apolygus lucorum]